VRKNGFSVKDKWVCLRKTPGILNGQSREKMFDNVHSSMCKWSFHLHRQEPPTAGTYGRLTLEPSPRSRPALRIPYFPEFAAFISRLLSASVDYQMSSA
jgi:hypothetical protein